MSFFRATPFLCLVCLLTLNNSVGYSQPVVNTFKPGARSVSLGGSLVTQAHDPVAIYWNPALLAGLKDRALLLSMESLFEYSFLGFTQYVPLYGTFGFSLARIPTILDTTIDAGSFAYGRKLNNFFSFGAGLNVQKKNKELVATSRFGFFIGNPAIGTPEYSWRGVSVENKIDRISLGLTLQNVPISGNFFETSALVGLGYLLPKQGLLLNTGYHFSKGENTAHAGLGYELTRQFTLSAGIEDFDADRLGVGLNYAYDNFSVQLTYSTELDKFLLTALMRIGASPTRSSSSYLRSADKYLAKRHFEAASKNFKKYLSYDYEAVNRDSLRQLIYALDRRVAKNRGIVDSMLTQVKKMLSGDDPKFLRAALVLKKVLELEPGNFGAKRKLSVLQPAIDKFVEDSRAEGKLRFGTHAYLAAKRMFTQVLIFEKSDPETNKYIFLIDSLLIEHGDRYFNKAVISFNRKKYKLAKSEIDLALEHDPGHAEAQKYLKRISEMAKIEESELVGLLERAEVLEKNGRFNEAANIYQRVLNQDPNNLQARNKLIEIRPKVDKFLNQQNNEAVKQFKAGNVNRAIALLSTILSIAPNHNEAKRNIVRVRRERSRLVNAYVQRGDSLISIEHYKAAESQFNKALKLLPNHHAALQGVLRVNELNSFDEQIQIAVQLGRDGKYLKAFNLLKKLVGQNRSDKKALTEYVAAKKAVEKIADSHFNQGIKYYTEDNYEAAIKELNLVLKYEPQHDGAVEYVQKSQERLQALKSFGNSR